MDALSSKSSSPRSVQSFEPYDAEKWESAVNKSKSSSPIEFPAPPRPPLPPASAPTTSIASRLPAGKFTVVEPNEKGIYTYREVDTSIPKTTSTGTPTVSESHTTASSADAIADEKVKANPGKNTDPDYDSDDLYRAD